VLVALQVNHGRGLGALTKAQRREMSEVLEQQIKGHAEAQFNPDNIKCGDVQY
jgi:hypothetical protein